MVYTKWRKGINGKSNVKNKILFGEKHRMRSLDSICLYLLLPVCYTTGLVRLEKKRISHCNATVRNPNIQFGLNLNPNCN